LPKSIMQATFVVATLSVACAAVFAVIAWRVLPASNLLMRETAKVFIGRDPLHAIRRARRPPILFLRSFDFDSIAATVPSWRTYIPILGIFPSPEVWLVQLLRWRGPVIAIGRVGETKPPPGALRFYVEQDKWQRTVEQLVPLCQFVVWTTGHTAGLRWEIEHLIKHIDPLRLILWVHVHVEQGTDKARQTEWSQFVEACGDIFPKRLPHDVKRARFITFDAAWNPHVLPSASYRPSLWERTISLPRYYGLSTLLRERGAR
jgi:hypothetical protein